MLRHVERDLVASVLAKLLMGQDLSHIYMRDTIEIVMDIINR